MKKTGKTLSIVLMILMICCALSMNLASAKSSATAVEETGTSQEHTHIPDAAVIENEIFATIRREGSYDEVVYCSICGEELSRKQMVMDRFCYAAGSCGDYLSWSFDAASGELIISGEGDLEDILSSKVLDDFKDIVKSVTIEEGITTINDNAFEGYISLENVTIPESVVFIGDDAFLGCDSIEEITYGGTEKSWSEISVGSGSESFKATAPVYDNENPHDFDIYTTATCTQDGYATYTCKFCGYSYTADVKAFGHTEVEIPAVEPTCLATGLTAGVKCATCGTILKAQEVIEEIEHDIEVIEIAPTCTTEGSTVYTCKLCGMSATAYALVPPTGHSYETTTVAATCTKGGYTTYKCHCGDCYVADEVSAYGHDYKAVVTEPTCTKDGYTTHICTVCNSTYVDYKKIPATGHKYTAVVTEPTCTKGGYTTYTCACGDSYKADYVQAKGHTAPLMTLADDGSVAPTCTKAGKSATVICDDCGAVMVKSEVIPATGHVYEVISQEDATCTERGCRVLRCKLCGSEKTEELPKKSHADNDMNGKCDGCGTTCGKRCSYCDKYEASKDKPFVGIFVTMIHFFSHLFGAK